MESVLLTDPVEKLIDGWQASVLLPREELQRKPLSSNIETYLYRHQRMRPKDPPVGRYVLKLTLLTQLCRIQPGY